MVAGEKKSKGLELEEEKCGKMGCEKNTQPKSKKHRRTVCFSLEQLFPKPYFPKKIVFPLSLL